MHRRRSNQKPVPHTLVLLLLGTALSVRALAADIPLTVEDSGSKDVDKLVLQLISTRPAPHPSGYSLVTAEEVMTVPYMTPQVSNAIVKLKALGTSVFPALVKHLGDDRYSYSVIVAAWDNLTVRYAVLDVLSDEYYMVPGYKGRDTPSGRVGYLSFRNYLNAREPEKWAAWAQSKTRLDIRLDFIDWCISKEQERGFVDDAQRNKVLGRYAEEKEDARKHYSEPANAANPDQPARAETNQTSSAADSRH